MQKQRWAVVLAAGSGTRLQAMTALGNGQNVPKQYCSLYGGPSLLHLALARAFTVVPLDRVLCIVAEEHEQWWRRELGELPAANVIVQPMNRGTAVGTLLPTLAALSRDSSARITFLPADHYVAGEQILTSGIATAYQLLESDERRVILFGLKPEEADPELGYIRSVPFGAASAYQVLQFVEKPSMPRARSLIRDGALWNSFVFTAEANALMALLRRRIPEQVRALEAELPEVLADPGRLARVYRDLPAADLSGDVFSGAEGDLAVLGIASCGWTDLGTPDRVARCLETSAGGQCIPRRGNASRPTHIALASACVARSLTH